MTIIISICALLLISAGYAVLQRRSVLKMNAVRSLNEKEVVKAIAESFNNLDFIADGKRWLGSESEIVCDRFPTRCENGFKQELLCRTNKGAWFVMTYHMNQTAVDYFKVSSTDESTAQSWLSPYREIYLRYFTLPETA